MVENSNPGAAELGGIPVTGGLRESIYKTVLEQAVALFCLERHEDESGVSGTGQVARGGVLPSGEAVLVWDREPYTIAVYESLEAVEQVHSHGGKTQVVYSKL